MFNLNVTRNQMKLHHTFNIIKFLFYFNIFSLSFYFTYYLIDKFKKYSSLQFNKFINNDYSSITIYNDFLNVYNHFYGLQYIILFIILNLIIINFINKSYKYHNKILHKLDYPTYDELKKEGTIDNINKCDEEEEYIINDNLIVNDNNLNNNNYINNNENNNKNNENNNENNNKNNNNDNKNNKFIKRNNKKYNKIYKKQYRLNPYAKEFKPKKNNKKINEDIIILFNDYNNLFDNILFNIDNKLNNFY